MTKRAKSLAYVNKSWEKIVLAKKDTCHLDGGTFDKKWNKSLKKFETIWKKIEEKKLKKYFGPKHIFHLDGGGPLDIPAVDKGKDGDAEDGEQFDHLEIKYLVNAILRDAVKNVLADFAP